MIFFRIEIGNKRPFIEGNARNDWEGIACPANPGHQRAGRRTTDLHVDIRSRSVVDFATTLLTDVVITDHALNEVRDSRLSGFKIKDVLVDGLPLGTSREQFPKLWEFIVTGKGGPAHRDSGIVKLRECKECGLVRYSEYKNGIHVDLATYDDSDFFTVLEYPRHILVSDKAKRAIEDAHLTNVSFIDSRALRWPDGVIKPT